MEEEISVVRATSITTNSSRQCLEKITTKKTIENDRETTNAIELHLLAWKDGKKRNIVFHNQVVLSIHSKSLLDEQQQNIPSLFRVFVRVNPNQFVGVLKIQY
jgi:hypothetical protein